MKNIKGLATGIGSLPYKDPQEALDLVFQYAPQIPFWPQLPKKDAREGMTAQFIEGLPCIKTSAEGVIFSPENKEKELEVFYEKIISKQMAYFAISEAYASGLYAFRKRLKKTDLSGVSFLKCHVTGPFTMAASIKDEKGVILLHDQVFMQAITQGLLMKALWQAQFLEEFGKPVILFIDEPYLACFGSAYSALGRESVVATLSEFCDCLAQAGILPGVHCCGNTDWSIFTQINSLKIINFDAFGFLDKLILYSPEIENFLKQERILCWGIVPAQGYSSDMKASFLAEKINKGIEAFFRKGLDKQALLENLLISPSCGLGTLSAQDASGVLKLLSEVSGLIRPN
ncbi:MAG: hypothetical protein MUF05_00470 [Candidatus Omnitrophica bacterium]|nr:hypothetical protein [Candidatus Omnitrophota bacterium]